MGSHHWSCNQPEPKTCGTCAYYMPARTESGISGYAGPAWTRYFNSQCRLHRMDRPKNATHACGAYKNFQEELHDMKTETHGGPR